MKYKNKVVPLLIFIFIAGFWGVMYYRIPLIQDAWASNGLYIKHENFWGWLKGALSLYNTLNGRYIATIIVGFFERNEFVLDVACALILTFITYLYKKCLCSSNIFVPLYALLALLLVPISVRTEVYFYATMIYIVPVISIIAFVLCIDRYLCKKEFGGMKNYILFLIVGYINAGWIEHTSFAFVLVFAFLILCSAIKNRKLDVKLVVAEVFFASAFAVMMLSPGLRLQREFAVEGKSTILVIRDNLDSLFDILFMEQSGMLVLLIGACVCFAFCNTKKFKSVFVRNVYVVTMLFWGGFVAKNFLSQSMHSILPVFKVLLVVLFFIEVLIPICMSRFQMALLFFYLTGLLSLAPVIATPNLSYRVCYYFFIMLNFSTVGIWVEAVAGKLRLEPLVNFLLLILLINKIDSYCVVSYSIYDVQMIRENLINEVVEQQRMGEWDYNDVLVLPRFSNQQLYAGASPQKYSSRIHYQVFLEYYDLDPNTLVYFGDSYDRLIAVEEDDGVVTLSAQPALNNISYSYQFQMYNLGMLIEESDMTEDAGYQFTVPDDVGSYYFGCVLTDRNGNSRVIFSPKVVDKE